MYGFFLLAARNDETLVVHVTRGNQRRSQDFRNQRMFGAFKKHSQNIGSTTRLEILKRLVGLGEASSMGGVSRISGGRGS